MRDIRQSEEYAEYMMSQGWCVEKINYDFVYIKNLKLFSLLKYQRPVSPDIKAVLNIAKKNKVIYIIYEPNSLERKEIANFGFKQTDPYLPSRTLILDLKKSDDYIYKKFDKDARYAIRKTIKLKLKIQNDIVHFQNSWKNAAARGRYILSVEQLMAFKKSFGENMVLITNNSGSSGAMFLIANKVGYYWYGFTSDSARATLIQYKIIYEGIMWAKRKGAEYFDFEGIYDKRFPNKAWIGFSNFKKKFGGEIHEFPGAYCKWRLPF